MLHKRFKSVIILFVAANLILLMSSCSAKMRNFEKDGMLITLTSDYKETEPGNLTSYYKSPRAAVTSVKKDIDLLNELGISSDISTLDYAELIVKSSGIEVSVYEQNALTYFEYAENTNFGSFKYLACVYKDDDAFWLVQFSCQADIYNDMKSEFLKFAQSVSFV